MKVRQDLSSLDLPIFTLDDCVSKVKYWASLDGAVEVEITPGENACIPSMSDKVLYVYALSRAVQAMDAGDPEWWNVEFMMAEFAEETNRQNVSSFHDRVADSITRMRGVVIKIINGGRVTKVDGLINNGEVMKIGRRTRVRIELSAWSRSQIQNKKFIALTANYYSMTPFDRRVYEIVEKGIGSKSTYVIGVDKMNNKIGRAPEQIRETRRQLRRAKIHNMDIKINAKDQVQASVVKAQTEAGVDQASSSLALLMKAKNLIELAKLGVEDGEEEVRSLEKRIRHQAMR